MSLFTPGGPGVVVVLHRQLAFSGMRLVIVLAGAAGRGCVVRVKPVWSARAVR